MNFDFFKYHGTGNDFIMIDNRSNTFPKTQKGLIQQLCHRHFGIGADGFILLEEDATTDFSMVYYNADGNESTMCGNGGRCIVAFAKQLGVITSNTKFKAIDGLHNASINSDGIVALQMIDVAKVALHSSYMFADTGSPHHIELVQDLDNYPVVEQGRQIRTKVYGVQGSNVNFVKQLDDNTFRVRTYERGVEDETLACGTGVTAVALAMYSAEKTQHKNIKLLVEGGELAVSFTPTAQGFTEVVLSGPAQFVFKGSIAL